MRNRHYGRRTAARLATIALGAVLPVMTAAAPAFANRRDDGASLHDPSLGAGLTIVYFVVIPLGVFLIIAGLSVLPSALNRPRYRPGKPWEHESKWFGGPADGESADAGADSAGARGGASAEW
ncbi:MAG: aa3-type cytochrome oxidase subunit CtaJ [Mycobacteriales bacterium]